MTARTAPMRVCISYAAKDRALARVLAEKLREAGLEPFLADRDIRPGESWWDAITTALRSSRATVILVTPRSLQSGWMLFEAGAASASGHRIFAVLAGVSPNELPGPLRSIQVIPFDRFDSVVRELERELPTPA